MIGFIMAAALAAAPSPAERAFDRVVDRLIVTAACAPFIADGERELDLSLYTFNTAYRPAFEEAIRQGIAMRDIMTRSSCQAAFNRVNNE